MSEVKVSFRNVRGGETTVEAQVGDTVMQVAIANNIPEILADCGGALSCATCHIHIAPGWFARTGAPSEDEKSMLELTVDPDETSRLSCQIVLTPELDGLAVNLPASQF